jgi:hypothetical protein
MLESFAHRWHIMRLMLVTFVVAISLIVDQLRFSGHYRGEVVSVVGKSAGVAVQLFR